MSIWKLLGIKWCRHVWNDDVRRTTKQPHLSAIVQARRFSLFSHIAQMPDEGTDVNEVVNTQTDTLTDNKGHS